MRKTRECIYCGQAYKTHHHTPLCRDCEDRYEAGEISEEEMAVAEASIWHDDRDSFELMEDE